MGVGEGGFEFGDCAEGLEGCIHVACVAEADGAYEVGGKEGGEETYFLRPTGLASCIDILQFRTSLYPEPKRTHRFSKLRIVHI